MFPNATWGQTQSDIWPALRILSSWGRPKATNLPVERLCYIWRQPHGTAVFWSIRASISCFMQHNPFKTVTTQQEEEKNENSDRPLNTVMLSLDQETIFKSWFMWSWTYQNESRSLTCCWPTPERKDRHRHSSEVSAALMFRAAKLNCGSIAWLLDLFRHSEGQKNETFQASMWASANLNCDFTANIHKGSHKWDWSYVEARALLAYQMGRNLIGCLLVWNRPVGNTHHQTLLQRSCVVSSDDVWCHDFKLLITCDLTVTPVWQGVQKVL